MSQRSRIIFFSFLLFLFFGGRTFADQNKTEYQQNTTTQTGKDKITLHKLGTVYLTGENDNGLDIGAAEQLAYDWLQNFVYTIGEGIC